MWPALATAQSEADVKELYKQLHSGNCRSALQTLRASAQSGNASAQLWMGLAHQEATGGCVELDLEKAASWYRRAAEQGEGFAQNQLGMAYLNGRGVVKDGSQALYWFRKAAENGNAIGQNNLGSMYSTGIAVAKDGREAEVWYRKAAEQGYAGAQYNLAEVLVAGRGIAKNEREAVVWLRKAAEQGHTLAQHNLGLMLANGQGVAKDEREAVAWYRKAAEQGLATAQNALGVAYKFGRGARQDSEEGARWIERAAIQGDAWAQRNLGQLRLYGDGVAANAILAHAWLNIASAAKTPHPDAASQRDAVASLLTATQLAEAERLARAWAPGRELGVPRIAADAPTPAVAVRTSDDSLFPQRPAKQPGRTSCNTRCVNEECFRTYDTGRQVRFQAERKFNPMNSQWEWDAGPC